MKTPKDGRVQKRYSILTAATVVVLWTTLAIVDMAGAETITHHTSEEVTRTLSEWVTEVFAKGKNRKKNHVLIVDGDLNVGAADVVIPGNVTIRVESGYRLKGNSARVTFGNSSFSAPPVRVFEYPDWFSGTGLTEACHGEWFGAIPNDGKDFGDMGDGIPISDSVAIQKCLDIFKRWDGLQAATYDIEQSLSVKGSGSLVFGNGATLTGTGSSNDPVLSVYNSAAPVENVNISDLALVVERSCPVLHIQKASNVNIHGMDIQVMDGTNSVKAVFIRNSSHVSIRNFVFTNDAQVGSNDGVSYEADGNVDGSPTVNNMLLDTGTVKQFSNEVYISFVNGGTGHSWTFSNMAFLDMHGQYRSGSSVIKMKKGTISNLNLIGCKSERHWTVFNFEDDPASRNTPGYINVIGFHAVNPGVLWHNTKTNMYSYWIGSIKCNYTSNIRILDNKPLKYVISDSNMTTDSMKLMADDFQIVESITITDTIPLPDTPDNLKIPNCN